jgi:hypothetical protein
VSSAALVDAVRGLDLPGEPGTGTLKREGYYAALQNVVGVRFVDVAGEGGLPPKMNLAVTDRRVLLFEQSMFGRPRTWWPRSRPPRSPRRG